MRPERPRAVIALFLVVAAISVANTAHADTAAGGETEAITAAITAAESLLAENRIREAAASYRDILADDALPAVERARVFRGLFVAYDALGDPRELSALAEAVAAAPEYPGNAMLLRHASSEDGRYGPAGDWPEHLQRLQDVAAAHPALHGPVELLVSSHHDARAEWDDMATHGDRVGALCDVMVVGPFGNVAGSGMTRVLGPERGIDPDADYQGLDGTRLRWIPAFCGPYAMIDLDEFMDERPNALLYTVTHVRSDRDREALLHVSGAGSFRAWCNEDLVLDEPEHRSGLYDLYAVPITLRAGWNQILVKAGAEFDRLLEQVRLTDPTGLPLALETSAAPPDGFDAIAVESDPEVSPRPYPPDHYRERYASWPLGSGFVDRLLLLRDLRDLGWAERAQTLLDELYEEFRGSGLVHAERVRLLRAQDAPEADNLAAAIADFAPEMVAFRLEQVRELEDQGETDAAFAALQELVDEAPDDLTLQSFLGLVRMSRGDKRGGFEVVEAAHRERPYDRYLQSNLSVALRQLNQGHRLREALERFHELRPDRVDVAYELAHLAAEAEDTEGALRYLDRALAANGPAVEIHRQRAEVLRDAGRDDEALQAYLEALLWSPQNVRLRSEVAELMLSLDQKDDAIAQLERALSLDPSDIGVRETLRRLRGQPPMRDLFPSYDLANLRDTVDLDWADPEAGVIYLFDDVQTTVFESGADLTRRHYAILISSEAGVANYRAMQEMTQRGEHSGLEIARAHRPDGQVVDAEVGYGELTFTDLGVGDVIEIRVAAPSGVVAGLAGHTWTENRFQLEAPCARSRFSLLIGADHDFDWVVHNGETEHDVESQGDWRLHTWAAREIPAVQFEANMPQSLDHLFWLDFTTVGSWDDVVRWYRDESEGRLRPTPAIESLVEELDVADAPDSARIHVLADWVRAEIEYEGGQFIDSPTVPRASDDILRTRYGDCKDQAAVIIAALRSMGIDAEFALVNSRFVMTVPYLPSPRFSHAIVHARTDDGREYWIDPTSDQLAFPGIPKALEGMTALLVGDGDGFTTIPVEPVDTDGTVSHYTARFRDDDTLELEGTTRFVGENGANLRSVLRTMPEQIDRLFEQMLGQTHPGVQVEDLHYEKDETGGNDVVVRLRVTIPSPVTRAGDLRILQVPWTGWAMPSPAVATRTRQSPLEMIHWRGTSTEELTLELPAGLAPLGLGDPVIVDGDFGRFELTRSLDDDGRLHCTKRFVTDRLRIEADEYPDFREFVLAAVKAEEEQVVLKRE